jgi:hypothetical protein
MQADADANQRLKELIAKIEIEQNPKTFSVLVDELNRLLDSSTSVQQAPATTPDSAAARHKNTLAIGGGAPY